VFQRAAAGLLPLLPRSVVGGAARNYVAGDRAAAREVIERLADEGFLASVDLLEEADSGDDADQVVDQYCDLLAVLPGWRGGDRAGISIAPSRFGLAVDPEGCEQRIGWTVDRAVEQGVFVRLGMEDSRYTDVTLRIYRGLRARHPGRVGISLQASLFRSRADVASMVGKPDHDVRLCKGQFAESPDIAWQERQGIRDNFVFLAKRLWSGGITARMATHDGWLFERLLEVARGLDMDAPQLEFQALLGVPIRETLRRLRAAGHPIRVYVPFGSSWYSYCLGRLRQRPDLAGALARGWFKRKR